MTVEELKEALEQIVQETDALLQPYFDSMPRRLQACIAAARCSHLVGSECPDGQNAFDCPRLLVDLLFAIENRTF